MIVIMPLKSSVQAMSDVPNHNGKGASKVSSNILNVRILETIIVL